MKASAQSSGTKASRGSGGGSLDCRRRQAITLIIFISRLCLVRADWLVSSMLTLLTLLLLATSLNAVREGSAAVSDNPCGIGSNYRGWSSVQDAAATRRMIPRDDTGSDPSFAAFIATLKADAQRGNTRKLLSAIASDVRMDFEPSSPAEVMKRFDIKDGVPWRVLLSALRLGSARESDGSFVAPYFSAPSFYGIDYGEIVVTGANVHVRAEPRKDAAVVGTLSHQVVTLGPDDPFDPELFLTSDEPSDVSAWAQVLLPSGRSGYIYGAYVRSPGWYRFAFRRVNGVWKIVAVTSGD